MKQLYKTVLGLISVLTWNAHAQNIAFNGDFESFSTCPGFISYVSLADYWQSVSNNRAAYFNACSTVPFSTVPGNSGGYQIPKSGSGYAFFMNRGCPTCNVSYVQGTLRSPLVAGVAYYFEMYLSLSDSSQKANKRVGVYFSSDVVSSLSTTVLPYTPQVVSDSYVTNQIGWTKVSGTFTAIGGEQYFVIGDYSGSYNADFIGVGASASSTLPGPCLYYLDDVYIGLACDINKSILGADQTFCGDSTVLTTLNAYTPSVQSYLWSTGSTQSSLGINNSGKYWVKMTSGLCEVYDTVSITYQPIPRINLGNDTTVCAGTTLRIGKDVGPVIYAWNGGVPGMYRNITVSGTYSVLTYDNGCSSRDTIVVTFETKPPVNLGSDTALCLNTPIQLSSTFPDSTYNWSTGSTNSTLQVSLPGTYWLEVNNKGCKNRDSINVIISHLKPFSLGRDTALCSGNSIVLDAASSGATSYKWNTTATTPSLAISTSGVYWVDASSESCTLRDSLVFISKPLPQIDLGPDRTICAQAPVILNAGNPGASFLWNNFSTGQSLSVLQGDEYWVKVTKNGCVAYDSVNLIMEQAPVIHLGIDTLLCSGMSLTLDATTPGAFYKWQDGSVKPKLTVHTSGEYKVELTKGSCKVADSISVSFYPKPKLDLGKDTGSCFATPFTLHSSISADHYLWQDGSRNKQFTAAAPGIYWLEVRKSVCTVRDSVIIAQYPVPVVNLGADVLFCKENSILLDAGNPGAAFEWNDRDTGRTKNINTPGSFNVKVTNQYNCSASDAIKLDTFTSPIIDLGSDSFVCESQSMTINAGSFASYRWQDGSDDPFYNVTHEGMYSVVVTDLNGCAASDSISISTRSKPAVNLASKVSTCDPNLSLTPGDQFREYLWSNGSTASAIKANAYGIYTVTVTDQYYCTNTASTEIINYCPGIVYTPNAFTPDGNSVNDIFIPVYKNIKNIHFKIYDRWGLLLFETDDMQEGWDGKNARSTSTSDVYIYLITYTGLDDHTSTQSGTITLLK